MCRWHHHRPPSEFKSRRQRRYRLLPIRPHNHLPLPHQHHLGLLLPLQSGNAVGLGSCFILVYSLGWAMVRRSSTRSKVTISMTFSPSTCRSEKKPFCILRKGPFTKDSRTLALTRIEFLRPPNEMAIKLPSLLNLGYHGGYLTRSTLGEVTCRKKEDT